MAPHVGLTAAPPFARDAGLLRRVRGCRVRGAVAARLLRHRRGSPEQRRRPRQRRTVRAAVRLRRRDDAERARQPVAGDRRRAGHRHHRRFDRRSARRDPLHVARRRHVLPRPHQPGRDGLLRRRLPGGAVGQPDGAQGLRPPGDDHGDGHHGVRQPAGVGAVLRLRVRLPRPGEGDRAHRSRDAGARDLTQADAVGRRDRRRSAVARARRPRQPGRHRGERAGTEGQGDRDRRVGGAAPAAGRVPAAQGRAGRRLVHDRRGAARRSRTSSRWRPIRSTIWPAGAPGWNGRACASCARSSARR